MRGWARWTGAVLVLGASTLLSSCEATTEAAIVLPRYEVVAFASERVEPAAGAILTVGGATVVIPPGALAEPAEITLIQTTIPLQHGAQEPLASAGQIVLSDSAYLVSSDRRVALTSALTLELPVDPARLPAGARLEDVNVTAYSAGYLHPQGRAAEVGDGVVRVPISVPELLEGPPVGGPPRGEGVGFFSLSVATLGSHAVPLAAGTAALAAFFQPVMATLEGGAGYAVVSTASFNVHYRDGVTEAEALEIAEALERARALYVDDLGFALPQVGSYFTRYNFYVADLDSWREYLPEAVRTRAPDGGTWAGSYLWGGSSYLNATRPQEARIGTAMHEYFHAVQWGVTNRLAPNSLAGFLDPEGLWLLEGTATAMAGRMTRGGGTSPSRDATQTGSIHAQRSIFDPRAHEPAPDVTQDLFVYLERRLGGPGYYREVLEAVHDDTPRAELEPSVVALDAVLRGRGEPGLSAVWNDFLRAFLWEEATRYGGVTPETTERGVSGDGSERADEVSLPPLSYAVQDFLLQRYSSDAPEDEQASSLQVSVSVVGDPMGLVEVRVGVAGGASQPVALEGGAGTVTLPRVRGREFVNVWVTSTNPYLGRDARVTVRAVARLVEAGPRLPYPEAPPAVPTCPPEITRTFGGATEVYPLDTQEPFIAPLSRFKVACVYRLRNETGGVRSTVTHSMVWQPYDPAVYDAFHISSGCGMPAPERSGMFDSVLESNRVEALVDVVPFFEDVDPTDVDNLPLFLATVEPYAVPCW